MHSVTERNASATHVDQFHQHSFTKKKHNQYRSNDEQDYPSSSHGVENLVTHIPLCPSLTYHHDHEETLNMIMTVMVMAPAAYEDSIIKKKLFQEFPIPFKSSRTELMKEILKHRPFETGKF
jgi:hypothetical protein